MDNDNELSDLEPINEVFETLLNQSREDGIEASVVSDAESEYNNRELVSNEISDMADNISFNNGVDKNTRLSLERYSTESMDELPALNTYTAAPSSTINFEETLTWVQNRADLSRHEAIQHGARYLAISLQWLLSNSFPREDDRMVERAKRAIHADRELRMQENRVAGDERDNQALSDLVSRLGIELDDNTDPEDLLNTHVIRPHRGVLNHLTQLYCEPAFNHMVDSVVFVPSEAERFTRFVTNTKTLYEMVIGWVKQFGEESVTLLDDKACRFTFSEFAQDIAHFETLQRQVGGNRRLDDDLLHLVVARVPTLELLMDDDDASYRKQWLKDLKEHLYQDFNLENMQINQKITILNPATQLQALNHNNELVKLLIDAIRVLSQTYVDFNELVEKKLELQSAYGVYLSQLAQ